MTFFSRILLTSLLLLCARGGFAQTSQCLSYQGRIASANAMFSGTGQFRFALINPAGTVSYWTNDGAIPPVQPVQVQVTNGLFSVLLGDATIQNMTVIPPTVFTNPGVCVRVWFSDGTHPSEQLSPDQPIAASGYAMVAQTVADGAVTQAKIADGAVSPSKIAIGAAFPVGGLVAFAGAVAPAGWLLCDGRAIGRSAYPDLFAALGTQYGGGDGSTTFNLPDLRGRVTAGKDNMGGAAASRLTAAGSGVDGTTAGASGGAEKQASSVAVAQQPTFTVDSHQHPLSDAGNAKISIGAVGSNAITMHRVIGASYTLTHTANVSGAGIGGSDVGAAGLGGVTDAATATTTRTADVVLSNSAVSTVQPTIVLNYIIKY